MSIEHDSDASGVEPNRVSAQGLTARTVQMIAIGGAIGTGLFYGSGAAMEEAGPALILAYALAAWRSSSSCGRSANSSSTGRSPAASASTRTSSSAGSPASARAGVLGGVDDHLHGRDHGGRQVRELLVAVDPRLGHRAGRARCAVRANLISVGLFGRAEFWFSTIKVTAILGMIVIGFGVLLPISGLGPETGPSVANLWNDGGFFATGFSNALLSLQIVMFAYVGVELVGVTAGEAENPRVTLRKAINSVPFRIGIFYAVRWP